MLKKAKKVNTLCYFPYYDSQTLIDLGAYFQLEKTWAEISSQRQDCIVAILKKRILKQTIGEGKRNLRSCQFPISTRTYLRTLFIA